MQFPEMCGGTSRSRDDSAPKTIKSDKMIFFRASCSFKTVVSNDPEVNSHWLRYISVYAAAVEGGSILVLSANDGYKRDETSWTYIKGDIFPELVKAVKEADLAAKNGISSFTHGLPENFGGEVLIKYDGGEQISFSDNQSPVFTKDLGIRLYELFTEAMKTEKAPLPDAEKIISLKILDENSTGYTSAELIKNSDETCALKTVYKFETPPVSEYTKTVSSDVLREVIKIVKNNGVLLWDKLPKNDFTLPMVKKYTFVFDDNSEITVSSDAITPPILNGALFKIESALKY